MVISHRLIHILRAAALGCSMSACALAQVPAGAPPGAGFPSTSNGNQAQEDPFKENAESKSRQAREIERQKRIVSDTERLLALANELKIEVASSGAATPTPSMLRKMDEIEKLAHNVKEKMRN